MHKQQDAPTAPIEFVGIKNRSLAEFKDHNKLTNRQVAKLCGISPSLVSHHLAGRRAIGALIAIRINDMTSIPIESLRRVGKKLEAKPNEQSHKKT